MSTAGDIHVIGDEPIRIDAWTGSSAPASKLVDNRAPWSLTATDLAVGLPAAPKPLHDEDWRDERVGWGVVLPYRLGLSDHQLARADDAGEPIQTLVESRPGARVFRYRPGTAHGDWVLHDYAGSASPPVDTAPTGTAPGQLPAYLLIVASPTEVPWSVQFRLNRRRRVGRLALPPPGLANYVTALLDNWSGSRASYEAPVTWAVDHGGDDITVLMREAVASPVAAAFAADGQMPKARFINGAVQPATHAALLDILAEQRPAVVVTSSHGQTGPLDDPGAMREHLGLLVDSKHEVLDPTALLDRWTPDGAVWFAQACCSAGSQAPSSYAGLFDPASAVGSVLAAVAALGAQVSPLPTALLGASQPLRAFIGHVEPTFDWTMVFPPNKQQLAEWITVTMYQGVCGGQPVGLALERSGVFAGAGALLLGHDQAVANYARAQARPARRAALDLALYSKVSAYDRDSTVLLGDPTAAIPVPAASA